MDKQLPPRPNLDHLRRQAKSLLAALGSGDDDAVSTILEHLPAAKGMTADHVRKASFRLADAQSAIARKSGFASWPQLGRHVEQLRDLEGTWAFASLEIDGNTLPPGALKSSRLLIDGDRFRTENPEAVYEGVFNIDVEASPHHIDIEFIEGPEAGNWNYGIFRIEGDQLEICLDMHGQPRPTEFRTSPGSGHACETLKRTSDARPEAVRGGALHLQQPQPSACEATGFDFVCSPTLTRFQGEWTAKRIIKDGQELPAMMCAAGRRVADKNEVKISFGGQVMIHALVRLNEATTPVQIDYYNLAGMAKGTTQLGIMEWRGQDACFCMAAPGMDRPTDFTSAAGSGRTLSQWRLKK